MNNLRTSILGLVAAVGGVLVAWSPAAHPWVATLGGLLVAVGSGGGLIAAADAQPGDGRPQPQPSPEVKP